MADKITDVPAAELLETSAAVREARASLAPPSLAEVQAVYGRSTVGTGHPTGEGETKICQRPPLDMNDKPTPSDDSPPTIEEAIAAKQDALAKTPTKYAATKRYKVLLNKRVEFERDFWLTPDQTHIVDGAFCTAHKADIDAATEVAE